MNLLDPTGRMASKRERQYQSLRSAFLEHGVDTRAKIDEALARMRNTMLAAAGVLVGVVVLLMLLAPAYTGMAMAIGALLLAWLLGSLLTTRRHARRFAAEELCGDRPPAAGD